MDCIISIKNSTLSGHRIINYNFNQNVLVRIYDKNYNLLSTLYGDKININVNDDVHILFWYKDVCRYGTYYIGAEQGNG